MIDVMASAQRLIRAATGDRYGDGDRVTDIGIGIAEPGYGDEKTVWVTGNWNPLRFPGRDEPPLTNRESWPARLGAALERIGVECLWLDEWAQCAECNQAIRIEPDSYCWTPHYLRSDDDYEPYCLDCFAENYSGDDSGLREFGFVDEPERAIPDSITDAALEGWGWKQYNGTYESGWYGREDSPSAIFAKIQEELPEHEVVFRYSPEQFRIQFTAWVKPVEE